MRIVNEHARVKVPATSGNLGPGFDALGMAHDLWDEVSVTVSTGQTRVTVLGEGNNSVPRDESHLIIRAMRHTLEVVGAPEVGFELVCRNSIPHGKGLGSSAAAVVAGIMLVRGLIDRPDVLDEATTLRLAVDFEGHPDNAAPAIYGGATASFQRANGVFDTVCLKVAEGVRTSLLVPSEILPTTTARAALPATVPHADAAFNAGRTALLVHALEHRPDLLFEATEDRLHQGYRAHAMKHSAELLEALRGAGWPAVISGAGPSILVFADVDGQMERVVNLKGFQVIRSKQVQGAHQVR